MKEHSTSYKVRVADAGADGKLKLPSLLQMLKRPPRNTRKYSVWTSVR